MLSRHLSTLVFLGLCTANLTYAQFCPATYHPHDRQTIRSYTLDGVLLDLINMHAIAIEVATNASFSPAKISALSEQFSAFTERARGRLKIIHSDLKPRSRAWLDRVAATNFPSLIHPGFDSGNVAISRDEAKAAAIEVNSFIYQIATCF